MACFQQSHETGQGQRTVAPTCFLLLDTRIKSTQSYQTSLPCGGTVVVLPIGDVGSARDTHFFVIHHMCISVYIAVEVCYLRRPKPPNPALGWCCDFSFDMYLQWYSGVYVCHLCVACLRHPKRTGTLLTKALDCLDGGSCALTRLRRQRPVIGSMLCRGNVAVDCRWIGSMLCRGTFDVDCQWIVDAFSRMTAKVQPQSRET